MSHLTESDPAPAPAPAQSRSTLCKWLSAETGTIPPGRDTVSWALSFISTSPAPKPDSLARGYPKARPRHSRLGKNVKEKTKKTRYLTPRVRAGPRRHLLKIQHRTHIWPGLRLQGSRATRHHLQLCTTGTDRHGLDTLTRPQAGAARRGAPGGACGPGVGTQAQTQREKTACAPPSGLGGRGPGRGDTPSYKPGSQGACAASLCR